MPPVLALALTFALIFFLFWRDSREKSEVTSAIWIPTLWFVITGSRFVSQWLAILGLPIGGSSMEDGSPIDAVIFFGMILAGVYILKQRSFSLSVFARYNHWIVIFLLYCLVSIIWSDFPFVAIKRWIKILGLPVMALVVLTDPDPKAATRALMKRSAYVMVLLSVLFIKYFPQYGRIYDPWTGMGLTTGIANSKNELGGLCMIFGVFFFWNLLQGLKTKNRKARRAEIFLSLLFLGLNLWLLKLSSSATSLMCSVVGMGTIWVLGLRFVNKRLVGLYVVAGILVLVVAEPVFGIYGGVLNLLGRDATLTDRTAVWHDALQLQPNPLLGAGFDSFWLGSRLDKIWEKWWWHPNQAHNGYVETYLSLGYLGLALLAGMIIGTFRKITRGLLTDFEFARLRLGFLFVVVLHNLTEAAFKGVDPVLTLFYLIAIDYPKVRASRSTQFSGSAQRQSQRKIVSTQVRGENGSFPYQRS
jgi:exopolysaccharide production protein ExoQ